MWFRDTLLNLVSGLGTAKDKTASTRHVFAALDPQQLEAAYRGDWVARKLIDTPPHDEVKNGRDWQAEDDQIELIEAEEKRLRLWPKVLRARTLARLYGGSAIYIGAADAPPDLPLLPDRIAKGGLVYLHVLSRRELSATQVDTDVTSPFYGEPEFWEVRGASGANARIHPSRIIRFVGSQAPDVQTSGESYWGDSVLDAAMDAVRNVGMAQAGVASLLQEAKVDVIRVPNLMASMADPEYRSRLTERFTLANTLKSLVNAVVLDKDEEWQQKTASFATLPDVMDRFMQAVAGAADIPATRLLGQAPQGMSATGESDYRNYLDRIAAAQELELRPALEPIDECIIRSALGSRPPEIHYVWAPLWQLSEKDAAEVAYKKAQVFDIDVKSGMLQDAALAKGRENQLIEDGIYPGLEAALAEAPPIDFEEREEEQSLAAAGEGEAVPEPA